MIVQYIKKLPNHHTLLHVVIHTKSKVHEVYLKSRSLTRENAGVKVIENGNRFFVFLLDTRYILSSTKELAEKLSQISDDIIIDLTYVSNRDKLLVAQVICKKLYKFTKYKTFETPLQKILLYDSLESNASLMSEIVQQINIVNFNRDFQNEPANIINPTTFCNKVQKVFKGHKYIKIHVFNDKDLMSMGLNMIHEMGKASIHKGKFLVVEYMPNKNYTDTIAIVGKGVCYDAGGLNLKSGKNMSPDMKADKTGGTTAISVVLYASESSLKCNVIALIPLIENIISGDVLHPGDIIRTYNKRTVEITDTNAEGRVIMTDALNYTINYPKITYLFDLATLTGQVNTFVPELSTVFLTLDKTLGDTITKIGEKVGDRALGLPVYEEFSKATISNVADYKSFGYDKYNINSTYMAGIYLLNFVPTALKQHYVHFDIANSFSKNISNGNCTILIINLINSIIRTKTK